LINRQLLPLQAHSMIPLNLLTKTLEWNLYMCIFNAMFDRQFRIRQSFTQDVGGLQRRFIFYGALNLLLSPFVAAFMVFFIFLKHAEEWYRRPAASALSRDYSRHARWMMQEFNELPHVFEARMHASTADANSYVKQFPAPMATLLAFFVSFIVSSFAAVLLVLLVINENILIYYRFPHEEATTAGLGGGYNLLWWLAMASAILTISRSFSAVDGAYPAMWIQPNSLLESLSRHTHYMPEHWRGKGHTRQVYLEFRSLYQYRVLLLLQELLGCITAPLLLLFALPRHAPQILEFMRTFTAYSEGVGHVCSFALFDFERHGDARYGAPTTGAVGQRSCEGKMEKAYVNFRIQHPSWQDKGGEALFDNIVGPRGAEAAQRAAVAASSTATAPVIVPEAVASEAVTPRVGLAEGVAALSQSYKACGSATGSPPGVDGCEGCAASSVGEAHAMHAIHTIDGRSTLGGGMSALGGSSLGASQLLLLSRSSQLLALAPHFGQSTVAFGVSQPPHAGLSSVLPSVAAAVAVAGSSETRSVQLAAELYGRMDQYYLSAVPRGSGDVECGPHTDVSIGDGVVGDAGNYELTSMEPPTHGVAHV